MIRPSRSSLFVPGNRSAWIEKAAGYGADTLILDLEDSVPDQEKAPARAIVKAGLQMLKAKGQAAGVRINGFATGLTLDDLEGIFCPELESVNLPKVETVADMNELDALLTHLERRMGLPVGHVETPLGCETAKAMRNIYEIATSCRRVKRVGLAAGPGGDAARAIGYQWTKEGTETLFLRSKAVLDARAAGIQYPTISSWWNIKDIEGLERDARWNRQLHDGLIAHGPDAFRLNKRPATSQEQMPIKIRMRRHLNVTATRHRGQSLREIDNRIRIRGDKITRAG